VYRPDLFNNEFTPSLKIHSNAFSAGVYDKSQEEKKRYKIKPQRRLAHPASTYNNKNRKNVEHLKKTW